MIYAYWHKPGISLRGRVANSTNIIYPIQFLDIDNITAGATGNTREGHTLLLGSYPGGSDLGRCRIRKLSSGNTIYPAWSEKGTNDGELLVSVGAYVTVLIEYRLWAKIPRIDISSDPTVMPTVYMDGDIASGDWPTKPLPVANVGPNEAGSPDPATGKYEVKFDVNDSWQFEDNVGFSSIDDGHFAWQFGGGTVVSGSSTSRQATVQYPPGLYNIRLDVQSTVGLKWHSAHKVVFVRNPANDVDTLKHQIVSHTQTPKGQEISVKFFQPLDPDVYRDGAIFLVWEEDPEAYSLAAHRMIFSGWHVSDETSVEHQKTADITDQVFRFLDINGKLEMTPGFSQEMNYNGAGMPTAVGTWNQTPFNNVLFYICFLLQWQSTALDVADLLVDNYILPMKNFLRLTSESDNLYSQVNKLANMIIPDFYLTCTQKGQLRLSVDWGLLTEADRGNFAPDLGVLADANWESVTVENQRVPRVAELMSGAVESSSLYVYDDSGHLIIDTLWCICPGSVSRGQGAEFQQSTNHLVDKDDQYTLNYVEGNRYARLNSPYGDVKVTATWQSNQFIDMDPGMMGRLYVWFAYTPLPRPFSQDWIYALIKEISTTYDYQRTGLVRTLSFTLEPEVIGQEAVKINKPPGINA